MNPHRARFAAFLVALLMGLLLGGFFLSTAIHTARMVIAPIEVMPK